ncbi:Na/Pi symporter [bacterium]|nr:Na/Pi symporter [bacterium]
MELKSVMLVLAGLALFLYALNHLSDALKEVAGDKMKRFLDRCTRNVFTGILTGIIVTVLLDSSSAVIIMTIALVNARAMTFRQVMGVVMGANIGTTISSQIFALDIGEYAAFPIAAGFLMIVAGKKDIIRQLGKIVFSFGLIFFGLFTIEEAVEPLRSSDLFISWLQSLESTWKGMFAGAFVTLVIQSSSATVGMVIGLASKGLMSLAAGIAVMLGAELGTCSDTLLASIGRSRPAVKTGLFHLLFNIITITLGMIFLSFFTQLVLAVSGDANIARKIANAHMLFNTIGVIVMIPFVGLMEKLLNKMVPVKSTHHAGKKVLETA